MQKYLGGLFFTEGCLCLVKVAGTVLKHANYSLLAVTTIMQYAHTYVHVAVRLPALRVINARVHVRFHREAILPEFPDTSADK